MLAAAYGGHQGMLQESGLRLELSRCPGPGRLLSAQFADGRPIVAGARYRVALPDFLALGGGGLEVMKTFGKGRVELGPQPRLLRDALSDYWRVSHSPLRAPAPGRIAFTGSPAECPR